MLGYNSCNKARSYNILSTSALALPLAVYIFILSLTRCSKMEFQRSWPGGGTACLQNAAHAACDVLSIRAEARSRDRPLEGEVVKQHATALVDQQGAAVLVDGQQQGPIWAQAQVTYLHEDTQPFKLAPPAWTCCQRYYSGLNL